MATTLRIASGGGGSGGGELPPPVDPGDNPPTVPLESAPLSMGRPQCPGCGERFSRGSRFCAFDGTRLVDAPEEALSDPLIGQVVGGKYTIVRPVGEGGMGTVYEVRHSALDRKFALKVLRPEIAQNAEHMQRFLQEAKAAAAIGHPNIVSVSDFGEHELRGKKVPFFVMEFLRGTSLAALLKAEKTLPPVRAAKIIASCAEALGAAHASGVIHRDLKPDNIFLKGEGGDEIKVLDFGVAKMQGAARLTKIGMVFGTPHYMSPEQARGQTVDHRADIYALGVILYECLSGHVPFEADTSMGVLTKQIFANPEPIERAAPDAGRLGALAPIVMRCLSKEPDERYASMDELAAALRQFADNPTGAATEPLAPSSLQPSSLQPSSLKPSSLKPKSLRAREEVAAPPSLPAQVEPSPRSWSRLVVFAAAGVAVLALLGVTARAMLFESSAAPPPSEASAGASAPPATDTQTAGPSPAASKAEAPPAAVSAAPSAASAPAVSAPAVSAPAAATPPPAPSPASSPVRAPAAASSAAARPPTKPPSQNGVVDPWGAPKKPTKSTGVVDPWATKKK